MARTLPSPSWTAGCAREALVTASKGVAASLKPAARFYSWGDASFFGDFVDPPEADGYPPAELWYGAHPLASARVGWGRAFVPLASLIERTPSLLMGEEDAGRFETMPYLLKVLAAREPLSIQVHPNARQAVDGFERESRLGIPLDAPHRIYRDANPKPELLVALTPFLALCGFRPPEELESLFERVPELSALFGKRWKGEDGPRTLIETLFAGDENAIKDVIDRLITRLSEAKGRGDDPRLVDETSPEYWILRCAEARPEAFRGDPGLLFLFMLRFHVLAPGEALFLPPGVPHAYLHGAGVEVMASSDNVIRAGLTEKYVDRGELLRTIDFDACVEPVLGRQALNGPMVVTRFDVPTSYFVLERVVLAPSTTLRRRARGLETILNADTVSGGALQLIAGGRRICMGRFEASLVPHGVSYALEASHTTTLFIASCPRPEES